VYPRELPDLFAGEELVLFGRYSGSGDAAIAVAGRRNGVTERYETRVQFPQRAAGNEYIARLWASRRIGDLDRRIRSARADGATGAQIERMVDELRETALRYGLLSQYTSYLVQEPAVVAQGMRNMPPPAAAAAASFVGQQAVAQAEQSRQAREARTVADVDAAQRTAGQLSGKLPFTVARVGAEALSAGGARTVGGRSFTLQDGVWQDARHTPAHRVYTIEPYSAAYFAILNALPELGFVLRELDAALIAGERASIRVRAGGDSVLPEPQLRRIVTEFRTR
jgi:Ca-activated chloride channel homolog